MNEMQLGFIRVSADDLTDVLDTARRAVERVQLTAELQDAVIQRTEQALRGKSDDISKLNDFRVRVARLIGIDPAGVDEEILTERVLAVLERVGSVREWQCGECGEWMAGVEMACTACIPDTASTETPWDVTDERLTELLTACGISITPDSFTVWSLQDRDLVADWAQAHLMYQREGAGVPVPPKPPFLPPSRYTPFKTMTNLLALVGVTVTEGDVAGWTGKQRVEAEAWATATHLAASDDDANIPDRPEFLPYPAWSLPAHTTIDGIPQPEINDA